jgi:hypothetical protein
MLKQRCELSTKKGRLKLMLKAADWHDNQLEVKLWRKPQRSATNHRLPRRSHSQRPARRLSPCAPAHSSCPAAAPAAAAAAARPWPPQSCRTLLNSALSTHTTACVRGAQCRASATPKASVHRVQRRVSTTPNNARSRRPTVFARPNGVHSSHSTARARRAQRRTSAVPNGACPPRPMAAALNSTLPPRSTAPSHRAQRHWPATPNDTFLPRPTAPPCRVQRRHPAVPNGARLPRPTALACHARQRPPAAFHGACPPHTMAPACRA